jgi:hypothetical protein
MDTCLLSLQCYTNLLQMFLFSIFLFNSCWYMRTVDLNLLTLAYGTTKQADALQSFSSPFFASYANGRKIAC